MCSFIVLSLVRQDVVLAAEQQLGSSCPTDYRQKQPWLKWFVWKWRWLVSCLWFPETGFVPAGLQLWVFPIPL